MSHYPTNRYLFGLYLFFCLVIGVAVWTVFRANGYRVLSAPYRIVKTGVISLHIHPEKDLLITLNNRPQTVGLFDFIDLTPGRYSLRIEKNGYQTWETTTDLPAGQAVRFNHIVLLYDKPKLIVPTDAEQKSFANILSVPSRFQRGLQFIDGEIWAQEELVTRYSASVAQALWLPDETHILALVGSNLHFIDLQTRQDIVLLEIPTSTQSVRFAPLAGGQKLVVELDGATSLYELTDAYTLIPSLSSFK